MHKKMTTQSKDELLEIYRPQYAQAGRLEKTTILNTLVQASGLSRKHLIAAMRHESVPKADGLKRGRKPIYDEIAIKLLARAWEVSGFLCSKRLVPFLPQIFEEFDKAGIVVNLEARILLENISPSTVDRLLKVERIKQNRSISTTQRGNLLKSKIPIRTFTEWNDVKPGFFEIDTVSHCANSVQGRFLSTLNMTDIATCWTEPIAIRAKTSEEVIRGFELVSELIPFPLLGVDFDNGKEFANECVFNWCRNHEITMTRSREYKKNDQAWIEEKNKSVVRKHVGRDRFEGETSWNALTEYYSYLRLYVNFFQPCQKLLLKTRNGARTYKKHDSAKTPCQRILENDNVSIDAKRALIAQRASLSMIELHEKLKSFEALLKKMAVKAPIEISAIQAAQRMATFKFNNKESEQGFSKQFKAAQHKAKRIKPVRAALSVFAQMRTRILELTRGEVFSFHAFTDLGDRSTIDGYLGRFAKADLIIRVGRGRYKLSNTPQKSAQAHKKHPKKRRASVR